MAPRKKVFIRGFAKKLKVFLHISMQWTHVDQKQTIEGL